MPASTPQGTSSPLNMAEIELIDSTFFPSIDKHHLRLLAHCLRSFQEMKQDATDGQLPDDKQCLIWCQSQANLTKEKKFILVLIEQMSSARRQLEQIAEEFEKPPLKLTLTDLIKAKELRLKAIKENQTS